MASNVSEIETFPCSKCDQMLDLSSKTLPCLHSFCRSCIELILEENGPCPQCQGPVTGDDLRLSPFLEKSLRRRQLQSTEWRCDRCFEENGTKSTVQIWCQDCKKILCQSCERFHSRHETKDLSSMSKVEAVRVITTDDCRRHRQSKDAFCQRCNTCLCKICYQDHVITSPQCPPRPLSVRKEASKEKIRSPTLERELRQFEINIRETYAKTSRSIEQLSTECESECYKLVLDFETFVEEARLKLAALCDNMKVMTSERQKKWQNSLKEKKKLLKKVEIWHNTLRHLSTDDADDEDVVSGLRLVRAELSARFRQSFAPQEKGCWLVTFPKWCHDSLESLKKEIIVWEAETSGHLQMESECHLRGSSPMDISSIVTGDEDNRVFVGDFESRSILEFSDSGEMVGQCPLTDGGEEFYPLDMCRLSEDILVVCCPWGSGRIFFLAQKKYPPFLQIQKSIDTKEKKFCSLCQIDKKIFACEMDFQNIVCFNENGQEIQTIHPGGSLGESDNVPRLRADPTTGNLWGSRLTVSEIFVWNQNGEILQKFEMDEEFSDFCSNKFGHFYFSTDQAIFSVLPEKVLFKFPKKSEDWPMIFVSSRKLFKSFPSFLKKRWKRFIKNFQNYLKKKDFFHCK